MAAMGQMDSKVPLFDIVNDYNKPAAHHFLLGVSRMQNCWCRRSGCYRAHKRLSWPASGSSTRAVWPGALANAAKVAAGIGLSNLSMLQTGNKQRERRAVRARRPAMP